MATLDIEPVELPPGRVEEMGLPSTVAPEQKDVAGEATAPTMAVPVNGADLLNPPKPAESAPISELPPIGPDEYRSMDDYRKLDWSKNNSELARIAGVSRQRIAQVRRKIEEERSKATAPQSDNIPAADFSDVHVPPGMATGPTPGGASSPETRPDFVAMAKVTFAMSEGLLCTIFGPEWKRESDDEMMTVVVPLSVCLEQWGLKDLPPGYVLCFVCLAYAGKRMNKPTTKDKIARTWLWLKSKFRRKQKPISVNVEQKEQNV